MQIKEVTQLLEEWAPPVYQESYDNCGLLIGNRQSPVTGILITLDCTEAVIDEAILHGCNLIIAHHPLLFKPLKRLVGNSYIERAVVKAIKKDISVYALHTNLDNIRSGVNKKIAEKIGLINTRILEPKTGILKKLITYVPQSNSEAVLKAIHNAGAGNIGNYTECSFASDGTGKFRPGMEANPTIGEINKPESVNEQRLEVIFTAPVESQVLRALKQTHPYEEPAFDIISLDNKYQEVGAGYFGELTYEMGHEEFLSHLKSSLNLSMIRHTPMKTKKISRVALCGGSGSFLLTAAKRSKADVYISSDFKYHEFFDAEEDLLIADINHFEGEVFTKDLIYEFLCKKISNIALVLSNVKTNPISYF